MLIYTDQGMKLPGFLSKFPGFLSKLPGFLSNSNLVGDIIYFGSAIVYFE